MICYWTFSNSTSIQCSRNELETVHKWPSYLIPRGRLKRFCDHIIVKRVLRRGSKHKKKIVFGNFLQEVCWDHFATKLNTDDLKIWRIQSLEVELYRPSKQPEKNDVLLVKKMISLFAKRYSLLNCCIVFWSSSNLSKAVIVAKVSRLHNYHFVQYINYIVYWTK